MKQSQHGHTESDTGYHSKCVPESSEEEEEENDYTVVTSKKVMILSVFSTTQHFLSGSF